MSTERLLDAGVARDRRNTMQPNLTSLGSRNSSSRQCIDIFDELPTGMIVLVSTPETGDISPMLLSYTIEFHYKQYKWRVRKKASQVLYLHFALKKRAIIEEFYEKQEQVKEWLHSLGIIDQIAAVVQDDDEPDDGAVPLHQEESVKNRDVPSSAVLPIFWPAKQHRISEKAKAAMQGYLNHFLGHMDLVNSREVCRFLEVSKLSFSPEYGPKLKEGYMMVKHLSTISSSNMETNCIPCDWLGCCKNNWQKVWAVLKPGFLAFLEDPSDTKLLDIVVFDVLPTTEDNKESKVQLATQIKERNPLRCAFKVSSGNRSIKLRATSNGKVKEWVAAINEAGQVLPEGWCNPHRFSSFAPPRGLTEDGSQAQWYIDGQAAFEAIASAIENAKSEILITGWWLCPELYLRRPFQTHSASRLDTLLDSKAKEGVKICILLYKEVSIALKINSMYSKKRLASLHENVRVLRYPDHFSTGVYLWSHHEKLVIIDNQICFIGGLDLCFGRYDTVGHRVSDYPPLVWPGKDYYNPRESEPNSWEDAMKDELDRQKYPRMPWHDVHCALRGPPCRDVARHFVQRWNHAKRNKAANEQTIPLLMPHHHMVLPHYMGQREEINIQSMNCSGSNQKEVGRQDSFNLPSPLENIPLLLPQEAKEKVTSDVDRKLDVQEKNSHDDDLSNGVHARYEPSIANGEMKISVNEVDLVDLYNETCRSASKTSDEESESTEGSDHIGTSGSECKQVGPLSACSCQIIRSVSQWSAGTSQTEESIHIAYCSLIEKAQHFIYIENQFFISGLSGDEVIQNRVLDSLYKRILQAHKEEKLFRVIIVMPLLPGFQGGVDDGGAATVRAIMHWQYRTISREKTSILHKLNELLGPITQDYISFYGLRNYGRLFNGGPVATSQVYVHSKLMIVDDRIAVVGSSNINDRSLLGSRDSEIGVFIEDKEFVDSSMNGKPWKAGNFSYSLRRSLWSEHLGLVSGEIDQISDPVMEKTYYDLWLGTAKKNTVIYEDVFACIPNESIHSRSALRQSRAHWKERHGHTTIDLGMAPDKLETSENGKVTVTDPMERLNAIKGNLVCFPLDFMRQEDLRPVFNESEFYASPQVFH